MALLLTSCGLPKPDCAKIGDDYDKVVDKCGRPDKIEYRNMRLSFIHYYTGQKMASNYLTIGFDEEKVNQIHYDDGIKKIDNYGE